MPKHFDRSSLVALGCIWLITLSLYILMHCISPLLPDLIAAFSLSHSMGGLLYAIPVLMIALFSFPLGILSDRIGMEASIGYGIAIAVVASFFRTFSASFGLLVISTVVFGLGFAFCFPNLPKLVKERFPPQFSGTVTGIYTTAIPLGTGLAMVLSRPILAATGNWQNVLLVWSLCAIPAIALWWMVGRQSVRRGAQPSWKSVPPVMSEPTTEPMRVEGALNRASSAPVLGEDQAQCVLKQETGSGWSGNLLWSIAVCGLLLALLNLIFYCTIGWLPTYLIERGWAATRAATATSFISFLEIPGMFFMPLVSEWIGRRRLMIISSFALMAICSITVALDPSLSWFTVPAFGITMGGVFSLLLSLPVQLVEARKVGRAAGAIISIGYAGALIGPPAAGYLRDLTGNFTAAFLVTAFCGLLAAGLSYALPKYRSHH